MKLENISHVQYHVHLRCSSYIFIYNQCKKYSYNTQLQQKYRITSFTNKILIDKKYIHILTSPQNN